MLARITIRWSRVFLAIILILLATNSYFAYRAFAGIPAPSTNSQCDPGGCGAGAPYDFTIYIDGSTYLAYKSHGGGNAYSETDPTKLLTDVLGDTICSARCNLWMQAGIYNAATAFVSDANGRNIRIDAWGVIWVSSTKPVWDQYDSQNGGATLQLSGLHIEPPSSTTTAWTGLVVGLDNSSNKHPFSSNTRLDTVQVTRNGGGFRFPFQYYTNSGDDNLINLGFYAPTGDTSSIACTLGFQGGNNYFTGLCLGYIGAQFGTTTAVGDMPANVPSSDNKVIIDVSNSPGTGMLLQNANRNWLFGYFESDGTALNWGSGNVGNVVHGFFTGNTANFAGTEGVQNIAYFALNPTEGNYVYLTPAAPTGTTSTAAFVMAGMIPGSPLTPYNSGQIEISVSGDLTNTAAGDGMKVQIAYGTGTAPVNGAAATGTVTGSVIQSLSATNGANVPFYLLARITSLTLGTAYWFDLQQEAVTGGTAQVTNLTVQVWEIPGP